MSPAPTAEELLAGFRQPPTSAAPRLRWWWFGPAVQRDELARQLTAMAAAGFGGVEVAYVYPLGPATTTFLSDDFLADLRFAADRAAALGLRFDLTLGSGWSFGGPHIGPDLAAWQLRWERREIQPGPLEVPAAAAWPGDELVAAYVGDGSVQEEATAYEVLPVQDGLIRVPDGTGIRQVLLAYASRTGQNVKRAAYGAEGPVLDHYSAAATTAHLRAVGDRLLDAVPAALLGSVFCDSLEVYGADWTPALPAEFARRRGYPLLPVLPLLLVDAPEDAAAEGPGGRPAAHQRVRADYHRTLAELYEESFVEVCARWAAGRGVPFRVQNYGAPPSTLSSARHADQVEGEGWGWREVTQSRWASSAAHLHGRAVVSSETWTWVHSPSFRATPLDLQGEAHEHLLLGINQFVGHGWPYSPADGPGLGWFFYAAGALDDRNPWWPAMPALNTYLTRLCWLLRQGEPVADVAVYLPLEDLFAEMGTATGGTLDTWREANRRIPAAVPGAVRDAGLDYDLVDDEVLGVTPADRYRVVVVPAATTVPPATVAWLDRVRAAGGSVLTVDAAVVVPGATAVPADGLGAALAAAVAPDLAVSPAHPDVGFVHRRCGEADVYLLANTGGECRTFSVSRRGGAGAYAEWDAHTGAVRRVEVGCAAFPVTLHPLQATVLVVTDGQVPGVAPADEPEPGRVLDGPWRVAYADEAPQPVRLPHVWEDEPGREHYSGAATYTTSFDLDPAATGPVVLDLGDPVPMTGAASGSVRSYRAPVRGPVGEVARVRLNGVDCGTVWAPPYRLDLTAVARPGRNDLAVTVLNTAANALAADEHVVALAADSEARYGRRFRFQELDRAAATVRSGLLQVPSLGTRTGPPPTALGQDMS